MKYAEEIKLITKKAEEEMNKEDKVIKHFKHLIKKRAKRRKHSASIYLLNEDEYNISFLTKYFTDEGFVVIITDSCWSNNDCEYLEKKITVNW